MNSVSHLLKFLIFLSFFTICCKVSKSQDLLVTIKGDSLNCKIISIKDYYEISYLNEVGVVTRQVPIKFINYSSIRFYNDSNLIKQTDIEDKLNELDELKFFSDRRVRFSLNGLYAYTYGLDINTNNSIYNYLNNQLRTNFGYLFECHLALNKKRRIFLGVQYSKVISNAIAYQVSITTAKNISYLGNAEYNTDIYTLGVNCMYSVLPKSKEHCLYASLGINSINYYENLRIGEYYSKVNSNDYALTMGIIYDYRVGTNWAIGCASTIDGGIMTNLLVNENGQTQNVILSKSKGINLERFTFTTGIKFYL